MSQQDRSRRQFLARVAQSLAFLGVGTSTLDLVASDILSRSLGLHLGQAYGATNNYSNEAIYVHVSIAGGAPRWYFDLPLNPTNDSAAFVQGGFGNWIDVSSGVASSTMKSYAYNNGTKTIYIPPVWGMTVGGNKLSDLLQNSVFIRGLDSEINSHPLSNARQIAPIVSGLSISGITADASTKPIAGLISNANSGMAFKSARSLAAVMNPLGTNPVQTMLSAFKSFPTTTKFQAASWAPAKEASLAKFDAYAVKNGLPESTLRDAYENAIAMINANTYAIADSYTAIYNQYLTLVNAGISLDDAKTIFPNAIKATGGAEYQISQTVYTSDADIRQAFAGASTAGPNLASMAQQFATADVLINNDLTSNATLAMGNINNLSVNSASYSHGNDQHYVGRIVSTLFTTMYYRSLTACLQQMATNLKAGGRFDRSLIHVAAEFNRSPRTDGSGSDHGAQGSSATLISGMFKKFALIGNIKINDTTNPGYPGTWGVADDYSMQGMVRPIQVNDIAYTAAQMMNLSATGLVTNGRLLFDPKTGLPIKDEANNA